ncbi:MAG TPA: hypothetical protein VFZ02_14255 [Ktedonobacteraceae bacterium]
MRIVCLIFSRMLCTSSGHVLMYSSIVVNCFLFVMCFFSKSSIELQAIWRLVFARVGECSSYPFMLSSRCLSTIEQAFSCCSLDHYSTLKRKKLLVSYFSPGLFGLPEKLQGTVTYTVKAGLLHSHTTAAILGARAKYGKEIVRYFSEETQADRAVSDDATQTALDLAGVWTNLS